MDEPEDIIGDQAEEAEIPGHGPQVIRAHLKTLPNRPGVYRMFDAKGDVIYVGKARSLKNRVASYTRLGGHTNRIAAMIAATANMEFVTTETEAEALLLEANLIKKLQAALQCLTARRQVLSLYSHPQGSSGCPDRQASRARAHTRAAISGPSPRPAPSTAPSMHCRRRFCCARAATASSRTARGLASSIRSSAARRRAPARSSPRPMMSS